MTAYCLFDNLEIHDPAGLDEYKDRVHPVVTKYGGEYVVMGGPWQVVEGDWHPSFPVMITFPDMAAAEAWYHSDDYADLKALRMRSVSCNAVFFDSAGLDQNGPRPATLAEDPGTRD